MSNYEIILEHVVARTDDSKRSRIVWFDVEGDHRSVNDILEAENDFKVMELFLANHTIWSFDKVTIVNERNETIKVPYFKTNQGYRNFMLRNLKPR